MPVTGERHHMSATHRCRYGALLLYLWVSFGVGLGWVAAGVCDATTMGGSGSWYPNSTRRSTRILVSALDLWRVGLTQQWAGVGVESLPASPPGWPVVARVMDGHNNRVRWR